MKPLIEYLTYSNQVHSIGDKVFDQKTDLFAVIEIYGQLLNLVFPIIMITVAVTIYAIVLKSTETAYETLNIQIADLGTALSTAVDAILPH